MDSKVSLTMSKGQLAFAFPETTTRKLARIRARLEDRGGRPVFVLDAKFGHFRLSERPAHGRKKG